MSTSFRAERGENVGPTWGNVAVMVRSLAKTHHIVPRVFFVPLLLKDDVYRMQVVCEAFKPGVGARGTVLCKTWRDWPTREHKTMPGLVFRLLHELDARLSDTAEAAQQGMPF